MKNKRNAIAFLSIFILSIWSFNACKKDNEEKSTDEELYEMSKETNGFVWYKNSSALLDKSSGSAHPQALLRTRYNAIAATQLNSDGKVDSNAVFPEGSLIVKELFDNPTTLGRYAILYKNSESADADAKGWVWGYINADGEVSASASMKGSSCINCHSQANNIDYMLMNKFFP